MKRLGIAVLAAVMMGGGYVGQSFAAQVPGYDNRGQGGYDNRGQGAYDNRDRGWDAPPDDYRDEIQRRGFRDGINGAQKDFENHRTPNVNNRDEYRHPEGVRGRMREQYRRAFRRGYDVAVHRMMDRHDDRDRRDDGYRR
jgi:hypothetical protein